MYNILSVLKKTMDKTTICLLFENNGPDSKQCLSTYGTLFYANLSTCAFKVFLFIITNKFRLRLAVLKRPVKLNPGSEKIAHSFLQSVSNRSFGFWQQDPYLRYLYLRYSYLRYLYLRYLYLRYLYLRYLYLRYLYLRYLYLRYLYKRYLYLRYSYLRYYIWDIISMKLIFQIWPDIYVNLLVNSLYCFLP